MELLQGDPVKLNWNDTTFQLPLWTWFQKTGGLKFTVDLGDYAATEIPTEAYHALQGAAEARKCRAGKTTYNMLFGQGYAQRVTYFQGARTAHTSPTGSHSPLASR